MSKFEFVVTGNVRRTFETREEAEQFLEDFKNSIFGRVHPTDCYWIREVKDEEVNA